MRSIGLRTRYRIRNFVSNYPAIYLPLADLKRRDKDGATIVTKDTDLVLDGFPRSGNTFAVTAFRFAQTNQINLAHHFHAPAQLIMGVRLHKPVVLMVRQPRDAVSSFVLRVSDYSIELGLKSWINFHRKLLPYANDFVVAGFDRVTSDFGVVIDDINRKFGTSFARFQHTDENVRACFQLIEKRNATRFGAGSVLESAVARPSKERQLQKAALDEKWQLLPPSLYQEALDLHAKFMERRVY